MQKMKKQQIKQNEKIEFKTLRNYTTIYHTYQLLYFKGHIQLISNHSNVNVEREKNNIVNKMTSLNSTHLVITLQYITLT